MASLHEIKARIANINSTKKVARAMYLISASKSQKAKGQLEVSFPYFQQITSTLAEILASSSDLDTPYIRHDADGQDKPRLFVIMGGDKGMAGGYNNSVNDKVHEHVDKERDVVMVAGYLGRLLLRQQGYNVDETLDVPVMNPTVMRAKGIADIVVDAYHSGKYHSIHLIYTEMVTSLKQVPRILQLLPLDVAALGEESPLRLGEIEYLPSARAVFDQLVPYYLKGILYSALVEAFASEQHSRMYAMDSANKNADDTIAQLSIQYNRVRQGKITQELTEIISGIPEG